MKSTLFTILLLAVSAATASARLGETWAECIQRYGKPERTTKGDLYKGRDLIPGPSAQATWEYEGFRITVAWLPPGPNSPAAAIQLTGGKRTSVPNKEQMQAFLESNSRGKKWGKPAPKWVKDLFARIYPNSSLMQASMMTHWTWQEDGTGAQTLVTATIFSPEAVKIVLEEQAKAVETRNAVPKF